MNKIKKTIGISCLILGVLLFAYYIIVLSLELETEPEINEVPCYDRFGNEIKDLVCEKEIYDTGKDFAMILSTAFLLAVAFILLVPSEDRI